ncbi:MAG TPA: DegT/DnrJ/EryC1/StrS family aminotransferase [Alphaproteobacteria bacterium]|nr:DegT/DnrJ/EryC1/StrS family aminotransferase [Alphaproteobacteria bacterium]
MISVFGSKVGAEEIAQISESITNQWLGMGPKLKAFEEEFKQHGKLDDFIMVDNGSNALYMAVTLLGLPKGAEVILPSFTWVSCAQAVLLAGCTPVFADVDPVTMNITAETIRAQITPNTKAIMVMHYGGLPVDMDPILALGYPVIEDAAQAADAFYKGRFCGSMGDVGIYSFDAVKNIAVGEGGGLTSRHPTYMARARKLRYCGIEKSGFEASTHGKNRWWEYNISEAFIKMNPSDISAGMAVAQLRKLSVNQTRRQQIWDRYQAELAAIDWIITPAEAPEGNRHGYFTYGIRVTNGKRDALAHYLLENGIYTTVRYHPLHLNPLYGQTTKTLPVAEALNEDSLCLPLHPNLSDADVTKIIGTLKAFA